jgi:hypothetical protein
MCNGLRRWIGRKCEVVPLGFRPQAIENDSGLHASDAARRVDLENAIHVLRKIEDDGGIATLPRQRCAATTRQKRSVLLATKCYRGENIFLVARNYNSDWNLTIVRAIGGIQGAAAGIKTNLAAQVAAEGGLKREGVELCGLSLR